MTSTNGSPRRPPGSCPTPPSPYSPKRSPKKQQSEGELHGLPRGKVLERTKSLEDILANLCKDQNKKLSPLTQRRVQAPLQLGRNAPSPPPPFKSGSDQNDGGGARVTTPTTKPATKKPEPARRVAGKKPYHRLNVSALPPPLEQESRYNSPPNVTPPLHHGNSSPVFSPSAVGRSNPKTYVAIENYQSQGEGCLSFREGDRCVLVNSVGGGWWLVNIGGKEGWTPAEFWQEDHRVSHRHVAIIVVYI